MSLIQRKDYAMWNFMENMETNFDELEIGQDEDCLDHDKLTEDDNLGILVAFESVDHLIPEQKIQFNQFQHALTYNRSSETLHFSHVNPNLSSEI